MGFRIDVRSRRYHNSAQTILVGGCHIGTGLVPPAFFLFSIDYNRGQKSFPRKIIWPLLFVPISMTLLALPIRGITGSGRQSQSLPERTLRFTDMASSGGSTTLINTP
jgi:hypothetical protein